MDRIQTSIRVIVLIVLIVSMMAACLCGCSDNDNLPKNIEENRIPLLNTFEPSETLTYEDDNVINDVFCNVGSYIIFGSYEQDNDISNGKEAIEWLVLNVEDGNALVVSKYVLDCQRYNAKLGDISWETCTLRDWLNSAFYNAAFSDTEKEKIITSYVPAEDNNYCVTNAGNDTSDNVFLLSIGEAETYFDSGITRKCSPTSYAINQGVQIDSINENSSFWLRSPGIDQNYASYVYTDGGVDIGGGFVANINCGIRPALWVDISDRDTEEIVFSTETPGAKPAATQSPLYDFSDVSVGEIITLGSYEQDGEALNGKEYIDWTVLAVKDGKALLISKYVLDCQPYNEKDEDVTWETCTLRKWLNGYFYNSAFSSEEKESIINTHVKAEDNEANDVDAGNDTEDKIFLISIYEARLYFNSCELRKSKATLYAITQGVLTDDSNENAWWWMRSPGHNQSCATRVNKFGDITTYGDSVNYDKFGVRPAMWIKIN